MKNFTLKYTKLIIRVNLSGWNHKDGVPDTRLFRFDELQQTGLRV